MTKFWNKRKIVFTILFVIGLFTIFFVGREFNAETGKRNLTLTLNGVHHFRKGLDVSGGTKLTYKISYEKYEELYNNPAELQTIKKMVETIILKNIDTRISKLGVSDYKAYVETLNNEQSIVVEIGGIADLDQAKEIIGKTVELEFRLPSKEEPTYTTKQERKNKAQALLNEIRQAPEMMAQLADGKGADNIIYNKMENVTIDQLPEFYKNNIRTINSLGINNLSNLISDKYTTISTYDEQGNTVEEDLEWYVFFRILDKTTSDRTNITAQDILQVATSLWLETEQNFVKGSESTEKDTYSYQGNKLIYNVGEIAKWEEAYKAKIFSVNKPSLLGQSDEDIEKVNTETKSKVEQVKNNIQTSENIEGATMVYNNWLANKDIENIIKSFEDNWEEIQVFEEFGSTFVVYIQERKTKKEKLFSTLEVKSVNKTTFENELKSKTTYTIEDVFVQNKESWTTAIDTKQNRILNWAYFKYANVSTSQVGEPVVVINFDEKGKEIFCNITSENIGTQMAIFVGGKLLTAPTIQAKICGGTAQIDGGFTPESAKVLVDDLNEGTLPAPLILMQEEKISPTLGVNALKGALWAGIIGIGIIFGLIRFMYGWRKALVTLKVLVTFLVILFGFMKLVDYALSLSGIAAIILSIGMWVDANILIFERIREELKNGKTMWSAIETAYARSWSPIRDGNISTWLIALLLFALGINMFKGFGSMMIVNILIVLFVNVPLTKELLHVVFHGKKDWSKDHEHELLKDIA